MVCRDNLVTDAFTWSYEDKYGNTETYSIPKINLYSEEVNSLNKEIYDFLYEMVVYTQNSYEEFGSSDGCHEIKYSWHIYDNILCLDVCYEYTAMGTPHMYYLIDINKGSRIRW